MTNTYKISADNITTFMTASNCVCCKQMGAGCSLAHLNLGEIEECFYSSIAQALAEERERMRGIIEGLNEYKHLDFPDRLIRKADLLSSLDKLTDKE